MNENLGEKRKKKLILIIVGSFLLLVGIGLGIYFYLTANREPEKTDAELLVSTGTWEKEGSPKVKWIFKDDGKGTLTTNDMDNYYDFTWELSEGSNNNGEKTLKISTNWLYTLEDEFTFILDREENNFRVVSLEDGKESTFVPTTASSSNPSPESNPASLEETEE